MRETRKVERFTFLNNTESPTLDVRGFAGFSIYVPASMTTFTSATYVIMLDDTTSAQLVKGGVVCTDTITPGSVNILSPEWFGGLTEIRIVAPASVVGTCTVWMTS